jgi:hypothetical protein
MSLAAPNITVSFFDHAVSIERSPLSPTQRRRFGNRLKRLHAYLGELKPRHYDHDSLVSELDTKAPCGSIACAFGHAVVSGKFKGIHTVAEVRRGVKPDEKGRVHDYNLTYKVIDKPGLKQFLKAEGLKLDEGSSIDNFGTTADAYFGPGAWAAIFDTKGYQWHGRGRATKTNVRKRIAQVAAKAYGVKVAK